MHALYKPSVKSLSRVIEGFKYGCRRHEVSYSTSLGHTSGHERPLMLEKIQDLSLPAKAQVISHEVEADASPLVKDIAI